MTSFTGFTEALPRRKGLARWSRVVVHSELSLHPWLPNRFSVLQWACTALLRMVGLHIRFGAPFPVDDVRFAG